MDSANSNDAATTPSSSTSGATCPNLHPLIRTKRSLLLPPLLVPSSSHPPTSAHPPLSTHSIPEATAPPSPTPTEPASPLTQEEITDKLKRMGVKVRDYAYRNRWETSGEENLWRKDGKLNAETTCNEDEDAFQEDYWDNFGDDLAGVESGIEESKSNCERARTFSRRSNSDEPTSNPMDSVHTQNPDPLKTAGSRTNGTEDKQAPERSQDLQY